MDVYEWSKNAQVGECVSYFRGETTPFERLARPALRASNEGLVFLAQRRCEDGAFSYEATRISRGCAQKLGLIERERIGYPGMKYAA